VTLVTLKFLGNPEIDIDESMFKISCRNLADLQLARLETAQGFFSGPLVLDNMAPKSFAKKLHFKKAAELQGE